jgi:hypothetical protein
MRAQEFIVEYRDRLLQYVKSLLPNYPEYVLKDWLVPNKGNFSNLSADAVKNGIMEKLKGQGLSPSTKWQLVPDMKFTMNMFEPMTKERLIGRAGGHSDMGLDVPRDKERHATQATLAQQQGGVRKEPVLLINTAKGYELLEGWHRTIQHFAKYPDGYTGPAYVAVAQGQPGVAEGSTEAAMSNAVTFFRGEPILSQERLNQLKSSIGKPYPILRKEGSAANIGTYMSPDGKKATSFVQQALAGQGTGGTVTQIQVDPNSFSKGDGGIDEAVIITNIAGLVSDQKPNENDPLRIQDRKQAMLKYLGPGVQKYLNDPLLTNPNLVQRWYNPEFAQKNWNTINSGKQAVTKPGESEIQERMISVLGSLAEKIRRDPEVISYFIGHNPGNWIEYNFRMNSDGSGTKVVDVKYYPPAKLGVAEGKIKLSTDPNWYGAEVGDYKATGPVVNISADQLVGFEPDDKMNQPKSKANVKKIVAGLKQGDKLPPLLVRKYKDGYQVLDGHHRFWAYKLLGVKSIPAQIVPAEDIEEKGQQGVAENFADGRNPQDKGDSKRHGINTKASVSSLRKTAKQGGRKGQLAHWLANMKAGRAKAKKK